MSRNLGRTDCKFCQGPIIATEDVHLATKANVHRCGGQYEGRLWCAQAECSWCGAEYLAWYGDTPWPRRQSVPDRMDDIVDLSFRSTFNDEWGESDLPKWTFERRLTITRTAPFSYKPKGDDSPHPMVHSSTAVFAPGGDS